MSQFDDFVNSRDFEKFLEIIINFFNQEYVAEDLALLDIIYNGIFDYNFILELMNGLSFRKKRKKIYTIGK